MVMTWTICGTVTGGGRDVEGRPEAAIAVAAAANKQCFDGFFDCEKKQEEINTYRLFDL
jgi:hypothetical protein